MRPTRDANHFTLLHEAARHAIHSSETLGVAVGTVSSLQDQISTAIRSTTEASESIRMHLNFQVRMLQNLLARAQSNKERLQNEIALVRHNFDLSRPGTDKRLGVQHDRATRQPDHDRPWGSGEE